MVAVRASSNDVDGRTGYIAGEGRRKHLGRATVANACPGSEERRRVYSEPDSDGKQKYALAAKIIAARRSSVITKFRRV